MFFYYFSTNWLASLAESCVSQNHGHASDREAQIEGGRVNLLASSMSIDALQEIGQRCGLEVGSLSVSF